MSVLNFTSLTTHWASPGGSVVKNPNAGEAGDASSISGSGRSTGVGNGNPLQYSCLENPMDIGVWWATVHGVTESHKTEQLTLSLSPRQET